MLVSSHTISVWDGWNYVPSDLANAVEDKSESDWVFFIPKIMLGERPGIDAVAPFLPRLELVKRARTFVLSTGVVYVATVERTEDANYEE